MIARGDIIDVALFYLVKRQKQGRPTTMRQVAKRVGLGVSVIQAELERHGVQYILLPYERHGKTWLRSNMEVAVQSIPESLAERIGIEVSDVEDSFTQIFGEMPFEPVEEEDSEPEMEEEIDPVSNADPYAPYRIDASHFHALKPELIDLRELISEARKQGYPGRAVERAAGGNRMRYKLPGPLWRPYVYRNKRYYLRETLHHLNEVYKTYKLSGTAFVKKAKRNRELGLPPPVKHYRREQMLSRNN